jgi:hypothetical protein
VNETVLGESLILKLLISLPFKLKLIVPPKLVPPSGWVPALAVAVMVQLVSQEAGAVSVMEGGESLQLWTSSVALTLAALPVLAPPLMKASMEKALTLLLPWVCLAAAGVQLVANLPDTMSIVWGELPLLGLYQEG